METLESVEIKAFIPAKDYEKSKRFYQQLGFSMESDEQGIAYFRHGDCSFLLQDFYNADHANNFMMHLLVKDVDSWYQSVKKSGVAGDFAVKLLDVKDQPWGMRDFVFYDPSGVVWRIAENI
ncbi:MAG: VOC family protein [Gammaproteobacteria bacterium]|nr:VOC family protein [Gammaproteobacteria bacterium]MDH5692307.1 VOC family protein [Gammaproteobacteria bacterium]